MLVLDASVAVAWLVPDEGDDYTDSVLDLLLDEVALVPAIWPLEVANVLLVGERRGRITEAWSIRAIQMLRGLPVEVVDSETTATLESLLAIGRGCRLSAYDASYLKLAMHRALPLAT